MGREREVQFLAQCLDAAIDSRPRLVLCRGDPGVGKTRLVEELSELARARGVTIAWGLGVESSEAPPLLGVAAGVACSLAVVDLLSIAGEHKLTADLALLAPDVFTPSPGAQLAQELSRIGSGSSM